MAPSRRTGEKLLCDDRIEQIALGWRESVSYARASAPKDNYYEIKYEDLCNDTRLVMRDIFRKIGLRVDDEAFRGIPKKLDNKILSGRKDWIAKK